MFFESFDIRVLFYFVPVILFIHEMEEWNINKYHLENYENKIPGETNLSCRLWLFFLSMFGFIWTKIALLIPNVVITSAIMMLLIDFTLLNGIQHIVLSLKLKKYNPGLLFGGVVGIVLNLIILRVIVIQKILPLSALLVLLFPIIPFLVESIISSKKNKIPKMLEWILVFSTKLENLMTK